ncbi:MAG: hypothetical protein HY663_06785 [Chloroflexi bacterium]|nr:hypothetical protein [Chloroflexota bacterium]
MRSIETSQKKRGVSTRPTPGQPAKELSADIAEYFRKTPLERQIDQIVSKWKPAHRKFMRDFRWLLNESQRRDVISTLKKADRVLKRLADWLRTDPRVPTVNIQDLKKGVWAQMKVTDYLAGGGLEWVAGWLSEINQKGGRPPEAMIARCAEEVADLFKRETGECKWNRVGEIVAKAFPESLPPDDGARDLRLWVYHLVKRNRNRRRKIQQMRESREEKG